MRYIYLAIIFCSTFLQAQNPYPQDYFQSPLDITLVLSGTFAELRSNHFHSGLDIKTQGRQGLKVYASAEGYVSRIKISHYGYGKALYITHPNGYVTVYAHLQKFAPKIEECIKQKQYENESYEIEIFPNPDELKIETQELIAFSGNTGGSGGPHLHFEIRDKQERPINPMLFGFDIKDTRAPMVLRAFAYPIDGDAHIDSSNEMKELKVNKKANGDYSTEKIVASGRIGFGVVSYDRQDFASNKNGLWNIQSFFNGNKSIEIDFKRFSFDETKHLNRLIDYAFWKKNTSRIQKLFIQPNNPLSMYKYANDNGYVIIEDSTASVYKVRLMDYKGNESWLTIPITGKKVDTIEPKKIKATEHFIFADQAITLEQDHISVNFPKNTFYDDFFMDFSVNSDTLKLHNNTVPAQKYFYINFDVSKYDPKDRNKLYIASVSDWGKLYYANTRKKGDVLTCRTKNLGTYTLAMDLDDPTISAMNFQDGKWLSKYRYLKLKIDDETTGVNNYRATINGKWILMEYDYKKNTLVYDFNDNIISDTKNILKVIVTDNVGNSSTFEATFYRK
ncbi:MAG: M23 family metallopeptidase [Bacteroidia bacterium]|nr:M23 family metallopeptidase [Bacteroidia bacterium]NND24855.1 M23 family metallopeptidase [Flavobacteriaceae bacterium]NNK59465.1 M23 family metallopeptidase [Flavobacteriaceae bacterium]NNL33208.1 M23 family metallopeptidase [Flavobacteriaceae bacterium]RZW51708.1 MAG: M23 family metallopeptidase [Flavobacteriaceae bacterium]